MKVLIRMFSSHHALSIWKEDVKLQKHNEDLLRMFATRMLMNGAMRAIGCWKVIARERKFRKYS